jgi:hypothetical protein
MITLEEFKEIQADQNYKHLGLFNRSGDPLVRFNSTNKSPEERLEMIEKRLSSPSLIDSVYIIKGKNNTQKDTLTDDYIIMKNENEMNETLNGHAPPTLQDPKPVNGVYNFKEGIELNSKLIRLELENKHLEIKIKELEEIIKDLEEEIKENETLAEDQSTPIQDFLQETLTTAVPLFDKFLELKERKIALQEKGTTQQLPPQEPEFRNLNQEGADILDEKIKAFILVQDPETQEYLKKCYNSSNTLDGFFTMVENFDLDLFEDLKTSLNG